MFLQLSALMNSLKAMKGQPLWPYEDVDLREGHLMSEEGLQNFVHCLRDHMDPAMLDQWIQEALTWSVESRSRHLACRSLQVGIPLFSHSSSVDQCHLSSMFQTTLPAVGLERERVLCVCFKMHFCPLLLWLTMELDS